MLTNDTKLQYIFPFQRYSPLFKCNTYSGYMDYNIEYKDLPPHKLDQLAHLYSSICCSFYPLFMYADLK